MLFKYLSRVNISIILPCLLGGWLLLPAGLAAEDSLPPAPADSQTAVVADSVLPNDAFSPSDTAGARGALSAPEDTLSLPEASPPDSLPAKKARPKRPQAPPPEFGPRALRYNGIYLNSGTIADTLKVLKLIQLSKGTPINGFVMDMKDDLGCLSYRSSQPLAARIGSNTSRVKDPRSLVELLHRNGLVACARVVSFKDPKLSLYAEDGVYPFAVLDSASRLPWKQHNGETWANPYDQRIHAYILGVIGELIAFGFDQIQLDYLRFPSDGDISTVFYPVALDSLNKAEVIGLFLSKVLALTDSGRVSLAADVFGWVPWLHKDWNYWIGQDYDIIARHADVICPMLYSSHFPASFKAAYGFERAFEIVREGTAKAAERRGARKTGVQPYIQGFKWRAPHFGTDYLIGQMKAACEAGAVGWIVWNARNDYTALWKALEEMGESAGCRME